MANAAVNAGQATRKEHVALFAAGNLQLVYPGWSNSGKVTGPIRVKSSIEYPAGNYHPVHFSGEDSTGYISIPAGATATSLPCKIEIPSGAKFFSNTSVIPADGGTYPIGWDHGAVAFNPPDSCTPHTTADYTLVPQPNPSVLPQYCYIPLAICGVPAQRSGIFPVVGIIGDSIAQGVGSAVVPATGKEVGIFQQACQQAGIGYVNFGINGYRASELGVGISKSKSRLEILAACTDVLVSIGSNDLYGYHFGRSTAPFIIAHLQTIWAVLASRRVRIWQATIPPKTQSTDGFRTLNNQSPWNSNFGPEVKGGSQWSIVNAYIRTVPPPLTGIIDLAGNAAVLNAQGAYVWKPGYTSDGTHPIPKAGQPDFISLVPVRSFG